MTGLWLFFFGPGKLRNQRLFVGLAPCSNQPWLLTNNAPPSHNRSARHWPRSEEVSVAGETRPWECSWESLYFWMRLGVVKKHHPFFWTATWSRKETSCSNIHRFPKSLERSNEAPLLVVVFLFSAVCFLQRHHSKILQILSPDEFESTGREPHFPPLPWLEKESNCQH